MAGTNFPVDLREVDEVALHKLLDELSEVGPVALHKLQDELGKVALAVRHNFWLSFVR